MSPSNPQGRQEGAQSSSSCQGQSHPPSARPPLQVQLVLGCKIALWCAALYSSTAISQRIPSVWPRRRLQQWIRACLEQMQSPAKCLAQSSQCKAGSLRDLFVPGISRSSMRTQWLQGHTGISRVVLKQHQSREPSRQQPSSRAPMVPFQT